MNLHSCQFGSGSLGYKMNLHSCQFGSGSLGYKQHVCVVGGGGGRGSGVTRALIGGGVYIHIFVFCPTNFF